MTRLEAAYIAGIMDGEGTITVSRRICKDGSKSISYRPYVSFASTSRALLDWVAERAGRGNVSPTKSTGARHKRAWRWGVWCNEAVAFLHEIEEFLVLKREHSELVCALQERTKARYGSAGLPSLEQAARKELSDKLALLNKRGVDV